MKKIGKVDRTEKNGKKWNDYRIKTDVGMPPSEYGTNGILDFENTCTANTVGLAFIDRSITGNGYYQGWYEATFPADFAGTTYDVYVCSKE